MRTSLTHPGLIKLSIHTHWYTDLPFTRLGSVNSYVSYYLLWSKSILPERVGGGHVFWHLEETVKWQCPLLHCPVYYYRKNYLNWSNNFIFIKKTIFKQIWICPTLHVKKGFLKSQKFELSPLSFKKGIERQSFFCLNKTIWLIYIFFWGGGRLIFSFHHIGMSTKDLF